MLGGLLVGMISSGLGEVNELNFLKKLKMTVPAASGISVFLVAMSAIVGVCAHKYFLIRQGELSIFTNVISFLIFTIPGVVLGAYDLPPKNWSSYNASLRIKKGGIHGQENLYS